MHTTAKAVYDSKKYEKFIKEIPGIYLLSKASLENISDYFSNLGLYNQKSTRLLKLAKYILDKHDGIIPHNKKQLRSIPGIGEYITNAILTFAFNKNEVPLDNNLKRIAQNAFGISKKKNLIKFYSKLAEPEPKLIYWALFDIGRFCCRKPTPKCHNCPISFTCISKNE